MELKLLTGLTPENFLGKIQELVDAHGPLGLSEQRAAPEKGRIYLPGTISLSEQYKNIVENNESAFVYLLVQG